MHGDHEDITRVDLMLTEPSQVSRRSEGRVQQGIAQVGFSQAQIVRATIKDFVGERDNKCNAAGRPQGDGNQSAAGRYSIVILSAAKHLCNTLHRRHHYPTAAHG